MNRNTAASPRPQTLRQAKKAFNRRSAVRTASNADQKRAERQAELERRAEAIRERERKKKENAEKRERKKEKEREARRAAGLPEEHIKINASQMQLGKFFCKGPGDGDGADDDDGKPQAADEQQDAEAFNPDEEDTLVDHDQEVIMACEKDEAQLEAEELPNERREEVEKEEEEQDSISPANDELTAQIPKPGTATPPPALPPEDKLPDDPCADDEDWAALLPSNTQVERDMFASSPPAAAVAAEAGQLSESGAAAQNQDSMPGLEATPRPKLAHRPSQMAPPAGKGGDDDDDDDEDLLDAIGCIPTQEFDTIASSTPPAPAMEAAGRAPASSFDYGGDELDEQDLLALGV